MEGFRCGNSWAIFQRGKRKGKFGPAPHQAPDRQCFLTPQHAHINLLGGSCATLIMSAKSVAMWHVGVTEGWKSLRINYTRLILDSVSNI